MSWSRTQGQSVVGSSPDDNEGTTERTAAKQFSECGRRTAVLYTRAFGDGPRHFESWSSDKDDTWAGTPSPNYHTNGRTLELRTDLTCIASLHCGSSVVLGSNS
ncbi:hypothetical protein TNCV_3603421 [Trichonephila clavipes]|nr:hypothetical protein TNCV_3603421 [Trichonephila clavipes]